MQMQVPMPMPMPTPTQTQTPTQTPTQMPMPLPIPLSSDMPSDMPSSSSSYTSSNAAAAKKNNKKKDRVPLKITVDSEGCKFVADSGYVCPFLSITDDFVIQSYARCPESLKAEACRALISEWGDELSANTVPDMNERVVSAWTSSTDVLYVMSTTDDGRFVGCVAVDRSKFVPFISHLYVAPADRGVGHGGDLLELAERYAVTQLGFSETRLWCSRRLVDYYTRHGYRAESQDGALTIMFKVH